MERSPEISVVILTYNPIWDKLKKTLESIILQEGISIEVIISDDGSSYNCKNEIEEYLAENNFKNYLFLPSEINLGTCKNVYKAIKSCKGQYIKLISPGDFLYNIDTLKLWCSFMKKQKKDLCFGDVVNYYIKDEKVNIADTRNNPKNICIYNAKQPSLKRIKENVLLMCDFPVGAAFLVSNELMQQYGEMIVDRIKYAEDFMYRIMVADSIEMAYYHENVVWYEYGEGISTSGSEKWAKIIDADMSSAYDIIYEKVREKDYFDKRLKLWIKKFRSNAKTRKYSKYILFPEMCIWQLICKTKKNCLKQDVDAIFLKKILEREELCK